MSFPVGAANESAEDHHDRDEQVLEPGRLLGDSNRDPLGCIPARLARRGRFSPAMTSRAAMRVGRCTAQQVHLYLRAAPTKRDDIAVAEELLTRDACPIHEGPVPAAVVADRVL